MAQPRKLIMMLSIYAVVALIAGILSESAFAKKPPKTYPEEGKIVGTGTLEHQVGYYSHTYTIETNSKVLWLDCPHSGNLFQHVGDECGGTKPLQVGEVVRFRVEKGWVFVVVMRDIYDDKKHDLAPTETEEKLRVLNEQLRPTSSDKRGPVSEKSSAEGSVGAPMEKK